jgi:sugar lactone lactonase YvrE
MIAIFLLTNCGGSTTPATATGGQQNVSQTIHPRTSSCPCLYAANKGGSSVTVYASGATGNATPVQDISGSKTGLLLPFAVAVDGSGNTYVTNTQDGETTDVIEVYAAGATGNVAPIRDIIGKPYRYSTGIAIDPINGDIYVAKTNISAILVYAPSANGDVAPIAGIQGSETGLSGPYGLAVGASGKIYVGNIGNNSVTVYAAGSTGNVAPTQTIAGTRTGLAGPHQLALDSNSKIYVADSYASGKGSLTVYAAGANGNVAPVETIEGSGTQLDGPDGIALDSSNNIYAANAGNNSITVYAAGSYGNVVPIKTITGSKTNLDGPGGIVIH